MKNHSSLRPVQDALFEEPCDIALPRAKLTLYKGWVERGRARNLMAALLSDLQWDQPDIQMAGRLIPVPRLQAWVGDSGTVYGYSGKVFEPGPWTTELTLLKQQLERVSGVRYNSALINHYRDGQDSVGWHADDEPELGRSPVIASVSLGSGRRFLLKPKANKLDHKTVSLELEEGDLLIMAGQTQANWLHCVPKTKLSVGSRVNLTFRWVR